MLTPRSTTIAVGAAAGAMAATAVGAHLRYRDGREGDAFSWGHAFRDAPLTVPIGAGIGAAAAALITRGRSVTPAASRAAVQALAGTTVAFTVLGGVPSLGNPGYGSDHLTRFARGGLGASMFVAPAVTFAAMAVAVRR